MKKIKIIGAGPGGLTAAMILAHRGFDVEVFEKEKRVGGRNACLETDGYKFDLGPTFLMMKFILDEVFEESGKKSDNYVKFQKLDPMYRLIFRDYELDLSSDPQKTTQVIKEKFPGQEKGFQKFLEKEKNRFIKMYPCLQKDYGKFTEFFSKEFLKAIPYLSLGKSMFQELGKYFKSEELKTAFTFQSKYLGMSPWNCPAAFLIIPYIEHKYGIYHVEGGLSEISEAMAKVAKENGAKIHLGKTVQELIIEKKEVKGFKLEDGQKVMGDQVIINADFAYSMNHLVPEGVLKKYSKPKLKKKNYSCSTFMLYLGLDKTYHIPHHSIIFADDYQKNIDEIVKHKEFGDDFSLYIRNASITDKTLAPENHSAIYVLVPITNNKGKINWQNQKQEYRDKVLRIMSEKAGLKDIQKHIKVERIITPQDWEKKHSVYYGATFNLAHSLMQMLHFRPHNKFEELENCYLVGGGTHPGSGLPTIYESARITSNLISSHYGIEFESKNKQIK